MVGELKIGKHLLGGPAKMTPFLWIFGITPFATLALMLTCKAIYAWRNNEAMRFHGPEEALIPIMSPLVICLALYVYYEVMKR